MLGPEFVFDIAISELLLVESFASPIFVSASLSSDLSLRLYK